MHILTWLDRSFSSFTDFLVNEVNLDGEVIHIESLEIPKSENKTDPAGAGDGTQTSTPTSTERKDCANMDQVAEDMESEKVEMPKEEPWPERFDEALKPHLSETLIGQLRVLFLEGSEPPFVSDSGWGSRQAKPEGSEAEEATKPEDGSRADESGRGGRGKRGGRGRGRGRGGNDGSGRNGRQRREDTRKVVSDVSTCRSLSQPSPESKQSQPSQSSQKQQEQVYIKSFASCLRASLIPRQILRNQTRKAGS